MHAPSAPSGTDPAPLLTSREAAHILGVAPGTLGKWRFSRRSDAPAFIKFGASVRYRREDLTAWIDAHREATS